jgi:signal transduction histidine kinase
MALARKDVVITLIASRGVILGRFPDNERWMGRDVGQSAFFKAVLANPDGTADVRDVDGHERFHAFTRVKGASESLHASAGLSRQTTLAAAGSARKAVLAGFMVAVVLLAVAAWFGIDILVVRPVGKLAAAARLLRARESATRTGLQRGPREIVDLSRAFDEMADSIQEYENQLRETTLELSLSEDKERRRIAENLHEHVGPLLATCYMRLGRAAKADDRTKAASILGDVRGLLDEAIARTQALTFSLSSPTLHTLGLNPALDQLCQEYRAEHGLEIVFRTDGASEGLSDSQSVVLYQAARELLRNAVKHAHPKSVTVRSFRDGNELGVEVIDDGVGFDATDAGRRFGKSGGFGLFNLRERFAHLGGRLRVDSTAGKGTRASVSMPVEPPRHNTMETTA